MAPEGSTTATKPGHHVPGDIGPAKHETHHPMTPAPERAEAQHIGANRNRRERKKFVLCFDGTGNKFSGTDADSNILKIYRMLDRNDGSQFHYYQPGIGTYVSTSSLTHTSMVARIKSAYMKAKDSAIGTSFAEHVMGGYRFLMRYYLPGDDIYFFGFSRGAYTARFLAEMLDHVGLLTAGNEEMCRFAWKTFQKWQQRTEKDEHEKAEKRKLLEFMCAFRETFSRPVRRIRFLGLFDTVNSVPSFENAWMQRSKFPYTARSTAKYIRHAVAIDERRAKFRQDLISEQRNKQPPESGYRHYFLRPQERRKIEPKSTEQEKKPGTANGDVPSDDLNRGRPSTAGSATSALERQQSRRYQPSNRSRSKSARRSYLEPEVPENYRNPSESAGIRSLSPGIPHRKDDDAGSLFSASHSSIAHIRTSLGEDDSDGEGAQDIEEVWFPGCHADIGGGWEMDPGVDIALSHVPLVWMVREAQRAGLNFDEEKLHALNCCPDENWEPEEYDEKAEEEQPQDLIIPQIEVSTPSSDPTSRRGTDPATVSSIAKTETKPDSENGQKESNETEENHGLHGLVDELKKLSPFHSSIHSAACQGRIHDVLQFNNGVPRVSVIAWNIMEYLPFRRMDLQDDGSWKSINWPLPKGEVRDVPDDAKIHNSVLRRMKHDETYRPGNVICGGGGRGVRVAPKEMGIGEWKILREKGDLVGEVYVRAKPPVRQNSSSNGITKMLKRATG